jgi:hypothetical protein
MKFIRWFRNRLSARHQAMSLYRQGMKHAQRHDHQQALGDYTRVIEMAAAPPDLRSMALYNRALVFDATSDTPRAIVDLQAVLGMNGVTEQVRTEAHRKLVRMERSLERSESQES